MWSYSIAGLFRSDVSHVNSVCSGNLTKHMNTFCGQNSTLIIAGGVARSLKGLQSDADFSVFNIPNYWAIITRSFNFV